MKIIYQGKEVGLQKNIKKVIDMFGDSIRISPKHVIACKCNNEVKSLDYEIKDGDTVELIDLTDKDGLRVYIRGALYIMSMALNQLYPEAEVVVNYQLANSMFCECFNMKITDEVIANVKNKMQEIIDSNKELKKVIMTKQKSIYLPILVRSFEVWYCPSYENKTFGDPSLSL